jgi:hypothetical protein
MEALNSLVSSGEKMAGKKRDDRSDAKNTWTTDGSGQKKLSSKNCFGEPVPSVRPDSISFWAVLRMVFVLN